MNRDDLIRFLSRAVLDGTLTEDEAIALLEQFERGELPIDELPLTVAELQQNPSDELIAVVLLAILALRRRRERIVDTIQDRFSERVRTLAQRVANQELSIAEWQRLMNEELLRDVTAQTLAGSGSDSLTIAMRQRIRDLMQEQNAYLSRFADTIAVGVLLAKGLSEALISNRAESYGGIGRGEYFRANEESDIGNRDVVEEYISRDDNSTCGPCLEAEGFYLPGEGPYPGQICLGRGNCRCRRERRIMPDMARRLRGG